MAANMILDQFYLNILECLPQVVLVATPRPVQATGEMDLFIDFINSAWESIIGSRTDTLRGKLLSETIYATTNIPWLESSRLALMTGKEQHLTVYADLWDKWLDIHFISLPSGHICIHFADITGIKQNEIRLKEQNLRLSSLSAELASSKNNLKTKLEKIESLNNNLEQLAYYDKLTQLPNRTRFNELIGEELENAKRNGTAMALVIMDIDNLKNLNDTQGHESGDELLRQMAQRLSFFENSDVTASRFGGDEFLLLVRTYEHDAELLHIVNSMQEMLREPYMIFNAEIKTSVSTGVATFPQDSDNIKDLLKYADIAMTDAKRRGKNTVSLFHSVMQEDLLSRIVMEKKMLQAMEGEIFQIFYQPQFDVCSNRLRGFEALLRWFDSDLGNVGPDKFIPLAEENRMIIPLGDWIFRTCCAVLKEWQEKFGFQGIMAINVSPIQIQHAGFVEELHGILQEFKIPPSSLEIEITEGILLRDFDESVRILQQIKDLGVGISLDDFGTGYSSLSYLQFLPLTTLKIDKSFIANITREKSIEYDITDAIVTLVNKQGLDTIAEGVETDEQLAVIRSIHCKTVQGFLTGRPMPKLECEVLLAALPKAHQDPV